MAPVAAASNSLFSILNDRDTRGSRPPYFRTRSRVSSSSAHWKQVQASVTYGTDLRVVHISSTLADAWLKGSAGNRKPSPFKAMGTANENFPWDKSSSCY